MKAQKRRAINVLYEALRDSVGFDVIAREVCVTGPLPWDSPGRFERPRPWTPADDGAARLWLRVPAREGFVRNRLRELAHQNRYFPEDVPVPIALAQLSRDGAIWRWLAKCPYCHELHRHKILGYWNQLQPYRTLGFHPHLCDEPLKGARGYTLVEQEKV